jgi:hypothetical protein
VIHGLDQGQISFPVNCDLHHIQEALATRSLFGVDLLVVRKATWRGSAIRSSLSIVSALILACLSDVF